MLEIHILNPFTTAWLYRYKSHKDTNHYLHQECQTMEFTSLQGNNFEDTA